MLRLWGRKKNRLCQLDCPFRDLGNKKKEGAKQTGKRGASFYESVSADETVESESESEPDDSEEDLAK
jgi:hypothetical protein